MLFDALIPSLEEVGARFERGDYFVPEMLIAARAMQGALDILRPLLVAEGVQQIGTFVMGTVKGDVHDIGKNLVNIMLEGAGFTVIDLGVNVPPERFVEQIEEHKPEIVGFSAFLTTTMPMFKANINAIEKAGLRDKVIIMVGGAPVTQEYADAVGADGYAADASTAVRLAKDLIEKRRALVPGVKPLALIEKAVKGPDLGLPDVRSVRAALDRHDLPDELPEDAAQRALRRRAGERALRGQARDALRVAEGLRARRGHARAARSTGARSTTTCARRSTTGSRTRPRGPTSSSKRDRQTPAGWKPGDED